MTFGDLGPGWAWLELGTSDLGLSISALHTWGMREDSEPEHSFEKYGNMILAQNLVMMESH